MSFVPSTGGGSRRSGNSGYWFQLADELNALRLTNIQHLPYKDNETPYDAPLAYQIYSDCHCHRLFVHLLRVGWSVHWIIMENCPIFLFFSCHHETIAVPTSFIVYLFHFFSENIVPFLFLSAFLFTRVVLLPYFDILHSFFLNAFSHLYKRVFPSVRWSVRPFVPFVFISLTTPHLYLLFLFPLQTLFVD